MQNQRMQRADCTDPLPYIFKLYQEKMYKPCYLIALIKKKIIQRENEI